MSAVMASSMAVKPCGGIELSAHAYHLDRPPQSVRYVVQQVQAVNVLAAGQHDHRWSFLPSNARRVEPDQLYRSSDNPFLRSSALDLRGGNLALMPGPPS